MNEQVEQQPIGYVHSLESFGSVDGPGVRYLIFLTGCVMRCKYCHNPDTWERNNGTPYTADELLEKAKKYRQYWGAEGGITVSGGDPLLQIDFLIDLCRKARQEGIHVTLDTSGNPFTREQPFFSKFQELMKYTDLILLDIKHIDEGKHQTLTGYTNKNILDLARYLADTNQPVWIRHVLVPGYTDKDEDLRKLAEFINRLQNVEKIEILPYHTLGVSKWKALGLNYLLTGVEKPSQKQIAQANKIMKETVGFEQ